MEDIAGLFASRARCKGPDCENEVGDSPSEFFCSQDCQQNWHGSTADLPAEPRRAQVHRWGEACTGVGRRR
jgi:hypothetical protein